MEIYKIMKISSFLAICFGYLAVCIDFKFNIFLWYYGNDGMKNISDISTTQWFFGILFWSAFLFILFSIILSLYYKIKVDSE
mgnify:CR=1 FL=1